MSIKWKTELHLKLKKNNYLKVLTSETMRLLGRTKSKIIKNKNVENVPHLEVIKVVLVDWNKEFCIHLFLINLLVNY